MQIKIKDQIWVIKSVPTKELPDLADGKIYFGVTKYLEQEIYINSEVSNQQQRQTLIHELTHAFMNVYGFGAITDQVPLEIMCDFIGCYADEIVEIATKYQLSRSFVVDPPKPAHFNESCYHSIDSTYVTKKFEEAQCNK